MDSSAAQAHATRASVSVTTVPLWRLRLARELPRMLLLGVSCAGLAASARYAIAPPRPTVSARAHLAGPSRDPAAEGFAQLFARRYLTWEAADPEAHQRALAAYLGVGMEADAGLQPPSGGEEQVQWTEVVQERAGAPGERVFTVAAQTDSDGLVYLAVSVARARGGVLELASYPALVGAPACGPALRLGWAARSLRPGAAHGRGTRAAQLPRGRRRRAGGRPDERRARIAARTGAEPGSGRAPGLVARRRTGAQRDRAGPGRARRPLHARLRARRHPRGRAAGRLPRSRWTPTHDTATPRSPYESPRSRRPRPPAGVFPRPIPRDPVARRGMPRGRSHRHAARRPRGDNRAESGRQSGWDPAGAPPPKKPAPRWNRPPRRPAAPAARWR